MHATQIKTCLLLAAVLLLSACGSGTRAVRGELPLVTLDGLERQGEQVSLQLGLRNINDQALELNEVQVRLYIDGQPLLVLTHAPDFAIGPRGREVLRLDGPGQENGLERLDQLDPVTAATRNQSPRRSVGWHMELVLTDQRGRIRETEASGFLHPVPGQPGRFR